MPAGLEVPELSPISDTPIADSAPAPKNCLDTIPLTSTSRDSETCVPQPPLLREYGLLAQAGAVRKAGQAHHSGEYGSLIIQAMDTGQPRVIYGNVANHGLISNLPAGCYVEVPCRVDNNGIQTTRFAAPPPHRAALPPATIDVQARTVEAALTGQREHIYHAAMRDPHTAAELDRDQIWMPADDLIAPHESWLPAYTGSAPGLRHGVARLRWLTRE
jgi:alpha-galactosidase/6-phospho-beta-glucosidase family protein